MVPVSKSTLISTEFSSSIQTLEENPNRSYRISIQLKEGKQAVQQDHTQSNQSSKN